MVEVGFIALSSSMQARIVEVGFAALTSSMRALVSKVYFPLVFSTFWPSLPVLDNSSDFSSLSSEKKP